MFKAIVSPKTFVYLVVILTAIQNIAKPRFFSGNFNLLDDSGNYFKFYPLLTLGILAIFLTVQLSLNRSYRIMNHPFLHVLFAFGVTNFIILAVFSQSIKIDVYSFSFTAFIIYLYISRNQLHIGEFTYSISKIYILGSLASIILFPGSSIETTYSQGFLPFRLHGIAAHANHLAPFAALGILESYHRIRRNNKIGNYIIFILSAITLIITQSKTTLLGLILWVIFHKVFQRPKGIIEVSLKSILFIFLTTFLLINPSTLNNDLDTSLTGRDKIWSFVIEKCSENPLFGCGADLWSFEMRQEFGNIYNWYPGQSHNMFVQSYGMSGIIGLTIFSLVFILLSSYTVRLNNSKEYILSFIPFLLIVRSFTESSMNFYIFHENFIFFILAILVIVSSSRYKGGVIESNHL